MIRIACWLGLCGALWVAFAVTGAAQEPAAQDSPAAVEAPAAEKHDAEDHAHAGDHHGDLGSRLPLWSVAPFAILLLCIAILPLFAGHWWEHNSNKGIIAGLLSLPIVVYLFTHGEAGHHVIVHGLLEYIQFIILLASLYIISGGVYIKGSLNGTPLANTMLMAIGAVIASVVGTTGASVLLVRPLLRANKTRVNKAHVVVFFIFIVSNCGGLLTPLGDPPLFMGFLKGVPFEWTLFALWPQWLVVNIALLILFFGMDSFIFDKEEKERPGSQLEEVMKHEPVGIAGKLNFVFLAGVVVAIYLSGTPALKDLFMVRELVMVALAAAAYFTTAEENRKANNFTFAPIIEVAVLFVGIFITMGPALQILNAWGSGHRADLGEFAVAAPWQYFWITGVLSSFLDNAPTYLTFASTATGQAGLSIDELGKYLVSEPVAKNNHILTAISAGAVFMGANTYIGNGPNFMVKAIAEENGVKMPSFFGYMAYSGAILIPIFIVVTFLFFRG